MPTIQEAVLVVGRFQNTLMVTLSNGVIKDVFSYYSDELHFNAATFLGMTEDQALNFYAAKDKAYLLS